MWAAPLGGFGGMAYTVSEFGAESLTSLGALTVVFWGTCAVFVVVVLGLVARAAGFSIFRMIRLICDELLIVVGTSSSETVLPRLPAKLQAAAGITGAGLVTLTASLQAFGGTFFSAESIAAGSRSWSASTAS